MDTKVLFLNEGQTAVWPSLENVPIFDQLSLEMIAISDCGLEISVNSRATFLKETCRLSLWRRQNICWKDARPLRRYIPICTRIGLVQSFLNSQDLISG